METTERILKVEREYGKLYGFLYRWYEGGISGYAERCADRGITPNDLTYRRLKLAPLFFLLHFVAFIVPELTPADWYDLIPLVAVPLWPAAALFMYQLFLDMQDGRVYRVMEERKPGSGWTPNGATLDHRADKAIMDPAFFCLWLIDYAPLWAAFYVLTVDMLSMLARPLRAWRMRRAGLQPDDGASNHFGKIKVWAWAVAWYAFAFGPSSSVSKIAPFIALAAGTLLALRSMHLHLTKFGQK